MTHELKTLPRFFEASSSGAKRFELRKDDRGFRVGDTLILREWSPVDGYSGRACEWIVVYILRTFAGLEGGHVVMSLDPPVRS